MLPESSTLSEGAETPPAGGLDMPARPIRPTRVALFTETTGPGGLETMLVTLAQGLRNRGHDVVPLLPRKPVGWLGETLIERGFRTEGYDIEFGWGATARAARQVLEILRRREVQTLHSHDFMAAVLGGWGTRVLAIPSVITLHGSTYYSEKPHRRWMLRWAMGQSRAVVAVSRALQKRVGSDLGLPEGRVRVIPNGTLQGHGDRERGRRSLGVAPGEVVVLAVGRLAWVKGIDVLLRAASILRDAEGVPLRIVVAGDGAERPSLEVLCTDLGLEGRVELLGMRRDIPDLLAAADLFVMPSRSEGLPMALLEAMGAGLPVVASKVGGIPEAVDEGRNGHLVEPDRPDRLAAGITRLARDPSARARMGMAARHTAEARFTADRMTDAYERLLCAAPRPQPQGRGQSAGNVVR